MKKGLTGIISCVIVCSCIGQIVAAGDFDSPDTVNEINMQTYFSEELWLENENEPIYGTLCIPSEKKEKYPLVIISHGLGTTSDQTLPEAQFFSENGFAAYVFDFCGGSEKSRSGNADGDMTHMSVLTEAEDLSAVIDQLMELEYIDREKVFLLGMSQGGYVSAYVAAQRPEDIKALGLEYPAFAIQDGCLDMFEDVAAEEIPDVVRYVGRDLGRIYFTDAMSVDIYEEIAKYTGDVLILHGDKDTLVDVEYSVRAQEVYESAKLNIYEGAAHGFWQDNAERARKEMLEFFSDHLQE